MTERLLHSRHYGSGVLSCYGICTTIKGVLLTGGSMIITNPKKDLELLKGLYELRIEMLKLQEELRSDPPSNPQIERNLRILGVLYPIWAGCVFTSGKKSHISRMPCMPLGHVMLSPATRRIRLLPGRKSHKKYRRLLSPGKRAARLFINGGKFNSRAVRHFLPDPGSVLLRRTDEIPSKEKHYRRNQYMSEVPESPEMAVGWGWKDNVGAACHQFLSPDRSNRKYVSPDGHSEVIFDRDGHIVTASEDYGTYNFVDSRRDPIGHFYQDVLPWLLWGNDENDSTDMRQRLRSLVVFEDSATALPDSVITT